MVWRDALPGDDSPGVRVRFQVPIFRSSFATGSHSLTHSQSECGSAIGGHTLESKMARVYRQASYYEHEY